MDQNQFYNGNEWYAYQFFGAHVEKEGVTFRVYAPRAKKVTLIGSFSNWHDLPMRNSGRGGIFSLTIKEAKSGDLYKYRIYHQDGTVVDKADPYGFQMELRPCSASIICDTDSYEFGDVQWMQCREKNYDKPMQIYELHFGSWRAKGNRWYRYEELADELIPYLKEMGYTHVELMPINEHPHDASWGYQSTGFFAATSRYGTPEGLKQFVDACHQAGIGVLLDFVFVHFAVDDYGLSQFDGQPLYENNHETGGYSEWGSYHFAYGRGEVASFLKSCANFWLTEYHFDGLRMDAVSRVIYLNGDPNRGRNEEGIQFLQELNSGLHNIHPTAMLIAEDSTNYLKVTAPVAYDGLGFDYKWDLGFMHDTLQFFKCPFEERKRYYGDILFSMHYFYNELYLLAFSHDEVVYGKKTILDKMYGDYEEKFCQCRALLLYMIGHPGKKLQFMGNEIGQFREWDHNRPQDFEALAPFERHQQLQRFVRDVNHIYRTHSGLYEGEYNRDCFWYVKEPNGQDLVYAFCRRAGNEWIFCVFNFGNENYPVYRLQIPGNHNMIELVNSDWDIYGGDTKTTTNRLEIRNGLCSLSLAPLSGRLFRME